MKKVIPENRKNHKTIYNMDRNRFKDRDMKLPKKMQKEAEKAGRYYKKLYESPLPKEVQELLESCKDRVMPNGMTQQEEIDWILNKTNNP